MSIDISEPISAWRRALILGGCAVAAVVLIVAENYLELTTPLGGLLFLPLLIGAAYLSRPAIFAAAVTVAITREWFNIAASRPPEPVRLMISMVAFTGGALFAGELIRNRRLLRRTKQESDLRLQAEQETRALLDSTPAAMVTVDSDCRIAKANHAARELFGVTSWLEGDSVENYVPALASIMRSKEVGQFAPTMIDARGRRSDGQEFYLNAWVSMYSGSTGPTLAAVLVDITEQVRDRAESGLRQLLVNSRIIAGAVSHELRNLAAAAAILHRNMRKIPDIEESVDYKALGTVIDSVRKLSSTDLAESSNAVPEQQMDLRALLRELRTIISPLFQNAGIGLEWEISEELPRVRAERSGLLQVLLNLARNSLSVLEGTSEGRLGITAYAVDGSVLIRFSDNGPGISSAERLFQPFQAGASSTGLGLFVSRAIIRTFDGELHHTQRPGECCFIIEFPYVGSLREGNA
jgi:PAS domain S-box-containing protein